MDEMLSGVLSAPVATLFIIAGIFFLFIAVVGNISGKIEPGLIGRIASGVLGLAFVAIGSWLHLSQEERLISTELPELVSPQTQTMKEPEAPNGSIDSVPTTVEEEPEEPSVNDSVPTTMEKEPNDHISDANLIAVGKTIRGSLATKKDRDYYKFNATSSRTRVILRKHFNATVDIYDSVENRTSSSTELYDKTITLSFESSISSMHYILVKSSYNYGGYGGYELVVKEE